MPFADGDVTLVLLVIHIAQMFPVFSIIIMGSIRGFTVVFGEDGIPYRRSIIVDVNSKGSEVLLDIIEVETPEHMPSNLLVRIIYLCLIILLNEVTNEPVGFRDGLVAGVVSTRPILGG